MSPIIGLTARCRESEVSYSVRSAYVNAVADSGALPLLLPMEAPGREETFVRSTDGILVTGGIDVAPLLYGQQPRPEVTECCRSMDLAEIALVREAVRQGKPVFGICRGIQLINVALGGTLWQDIPAQLHSEICHRQSLEARRELTHTVHIVPGTKLAELLQVQELEVNSMHHQCIRDLAPGLRISAAAPDGIPEAYENEDGSVLGVQWHPEELYRRYSLHAKLFEAFTERCRTGK